MTIFQKHMVAGAGIITVLFCGLVIYAIRIAPRMAHDSNVVVESFYRRCQAKNYSGARALLSQSLQADMPDEKLKEFWREFEKKHGKLQNWKVADGISIKGFGGSVCVFPPFVDYRHAVSGAKGSGTLIYIRVIPESEQWRIERFSSLR